ncbi:MAG: hypothetical protein GTN70_06670 [Deltaproteobacteria bacterium]|nr:hypothetical protein [Deltaproteobacteria bacterium]NIS77369.1 hypothetical protein [Deltaproteobacteria bacterium]
MNCHAENRGDGARYAGWRVHPSREMMRLKAVGAVTEVTSARKTMESPSACSMKPSLSPIAAAAMIRVSRADRRIPDAAA